MSGAEARMLAAASVTTLLSADWKPATRTLPLRSPPIAASSSSAELTLPRISAARCASSSPAGVSRMPRPARCVRGSPTSASSRERWWLIEGWAYPSSRAAAVTEPCRATAASTFSRTRSSIHRIISNIHRRNWH